MNMTAERTALIDWLRAQISELESACDDLPFGLDEDDAMQMETMRIALAALTAPQPEPVCYRYD